MVEKMRAKILALGGEIRFGESRGETDRRGARPGARRCCSPAVKRLRADHVVLAVGHSARDTFEMLHERGVFMEAKPFSIGFRIEHPQGLIDRARYGERRPSVAGCGRLQVGAPRRNGRTVYSFCMCPGGTVVAATSEPGAWSPMA